MFESFVAKKTKVVPVVSTIISPPMGNQAAALEFLGGVFSSLETKKKEACAEIDNKHNSVEKYLHTALTHAEASVSLFGEDIDKLSAHIKGKKFDKTAFNNLVLPAHTIKYKLLQDGLFKMSAVTECLDWLYNQRAPDSVLGILNLVKRYDLHGRNEAYMTFKDNIESLAHYADEETMHNACNGYYTDAPGTKLTDAGYPPTFVTDLISKSRQIVSQMHSVMAYYEKHEQAKSKFKQMIMSATTRDSIGAIQALCHIATHNTAAAINATCVQSFDILALNVADFIVKHCYK